MILNSLRPGADIVRDPLGFDPATASFGAYRSMIDTIPIGLGFLNTAIVLVGRGAITMVFCPLRGTGSRSTPSAGSESSSRCCW
jgi:ABC-type glycerol-3-phosphate transport system permease component